ncbi:MAG: CHAT domain-containing tetratricopeptide repeat protein [Caldilineaceae bacterium]
MHTNSFRAALAVLGVGNREMLNYLVERALDEQEYACLALDPSVTVHNGLLHLAPDVAAVQLKALEQADFLHFRRLHERAIAYLSRRLEQGGQSVEPIFAAIFIRLAEWLITQAPQQLFALVDQVRILPVSPKTHHYRSLFEGIALRHLERYAEALALFNTLLAEPDLDLDVRGRGLNARGLAHFWQGRLQQALDDYAASLTIWQRTGNRVQEGLVRLHLGIVAYELHDYAQAEQHLDIAELLFRATQTSTWLPSVLNERGLVYRDQGRWDEALACFERSLAQRRAEGSAHRVGVILNNVGEVLLLQGKLADARQAFIESLEKMTVDNVRIDTLLNLGLLQQLAGDLALAKDCYTEALTTAQRIARHDILPSIHYRLADLATRQAQPTLALHHLFTGIEQIEATRTPLRDEGLRISLLGRWQQLYEAAVLLLVEQERFGEALTLVERARARALFEMVGTETLTGEEPLAVEPICQQLPADMALLEFFATGLPGSHAALIAQLSAEASGLRALLLPPERVLLFCVCDGTVSCVALPVRLDQIDAQHFQRSNGRLRGIIPLPGQRLRPMRRWLDLGMALFAPLRSQLKQKRHLVFVPHALLHYLPLHALVDLAQLTQVSATSASYAPSASIFFAKLSQGQQNAPFSPSRRLAIGVNAGGLTHAEAEARWVAHHLDGALLVGEQATPAAVLQALQAADIIHISCHGLFRQRRPMESALMVYEGEVNAAALLTQVKLKARLVTLSACDTGLNRLEPGDEPLGLTRAVLGCGAHTLLATLWPVHEVPTRLFMTHFYTQWLRGLNKADALRAAQRWLATLTWADLRQQLGEFGLSATECEPMLTLFQAMLAGGHPFDHPYYWAPFVLIGDPI